MPTSKQDVSMRDLLASCAAANAVSTPPRATAAGDRTGTDDGTTPAPGARVHDVPHAGATAPDDAAHAAEERRRAA
ncbi:hypothetical protein ACQI4E_16515 [Streptomyces sp. CA-252508]|uniref:hypothetical protein n=1 Tax=Streptomyces sp. CA-252508 TaxID=3418946 RepID=UPI003D94A6AD